MDPEEELLNAAFAAFPTAGRVTVGLTPDPWVRIMVGSVAGEVHIPRSLAHEQWAGELAHQFNILKKHLEVPND
jgi:hypothetical protein